MENFYDMAWGVPPPPARVWPGRRPYGVIVGEELRGKRQTSENNGIKTNITD